MRRAGGTGRHAPAVERGEQRGALGLGARLPQRIVASPRRAAIDMQAVLDREVLEVAEPGVDPAQRLVGIDVAARRRPRAPGRCAARSRRSAARAARAAGGRGRRPARIRRPAARALRASPDSSASDQRRRQMADGHGGDAALGLRGLARIADDERIDHRQRRRRPLRGSRTRSAPPPCPAAIRACHARPCARWRRPRATCRSQSPKASSACRGGSVGS